ncbi:MAG TPA: hypothetical protein VF883_17400 [Thermoanaerobaculia bacterium]
MTDWKDALAPSPECIDLARLGEKLDAAERAHVDTCARCQAELAMFREISREETSAGEAREVEWVASELRRRNNVVAFRPKAWRVLYAAAAVLVMVIGIGYWMQMREPAIDATIDGPSVYRSARLDVIAPVGDLVQAPNELRWTAVPDASRYRVQIAEVDGTLLWSAGTTQANVALPPAVIAQFAPGKSLLWEVKAFRGEEMLASSETQTVRVSVAPPRKDR